MRLIISLVRFIFNFILFLTGSVALVVIAALLYAHEMVTDDSQIVIETGSLPFISLLDAEARALYPVLQARADELNSPFSNDASLIYFNVGEGETALVVAERLQSLRLIYDAELFGQLLRYNGIDTRFKSGDYYLRRNMTMRQIGAALYHGRSALVTLPIPPGWRMEQLADHLAQTESLDGGQFLLLARGGSVVEHPLLADRPAGQSYEGYLFPGTYFLPEDAPPEMLITQMLNSMARQLPANAVDLARQQGLSFYQVLILASIVEREAALAEEKPIIASVYLNRLNPYYGYSYLQADPTVQYALGYQPNTGQWWKSPVQLEEYPLIDSPYNTYLYPGLPPGPIASPGLDSILAVLQPAQTDYLFFVCRRPGCEGGAHTFARSYEEHLQNVAVYWGE